jgi:hypothetical protein
VPLLVKDKTHGQHLKNQNNARAQLRRVRLHRGLTAKAKAKRPKKKSKTAKSLAPGVWKMWPALLPHLLFQCLEKADLMRNVTLGWMPEIVFLDLEITNQLQPMVICLSCLSPYFFFQRDLCWTGGAGMWTGCSSGRWREPTRSGASGLCQH